MHNATVSVEEILKTLEDLSLAASSFVRGRGLEDPRKNLRDSIERVNHVLDADVTIDGITDPDLLIESFIASGGDWQKFTASVSRHSLDGATRGIGA